MASNSFCKRSAGGHGSADGSTSGVRAAGPPNSSDCPTSAEFVRALRRSQDRVDRREGARPVAVECIERAGGREAFQHPLVDRARIDAAREIGEIGERLVAARRNDRVDRLGADAVQRRQRIVDRLALDLEGDARPVDRRRHDLDAEPLGLGAEFGELVGIAHVERHRRRQELDRIVRLHIGGLVGDQRIGGGVALVEAVFREAFAARSKIASACWRSIPRSVAPVMKPSRCDCISFRIFLPIARRRMSASPNV